MFPTADAFHDGHDPARNQALVGDEYGGLVTFPFPSAELNLLAVHPQLVQTARTLLRTDDIRLYSAEAWAKFTGACDYEQEHHRDFLNHTVVVPSTDPQWRHVELFVFLHDMDETLGPTHAVSLTASPDLPDVLHVASRSAYPGLYDAEVSAAGPAGTVLAYRGETLHRATNLIAPRGARYTLHCSFRPAAAEWIGRVGWGDRSFTPHWNPFVARATPEQLTLFGFPPPGHPFWTTQTLALLEARYPELDVRPWVIESNQTA